MRTKNAAWWQLRGSYRPLGRLLRQSASVALLAFGTWVELCLLAYSMDVGVNVPSSCLGNVWR